MVQRYPGDPGLRQSLPRSPASLPGEAGVALLVTILVLLIVSMLGATVVTLGRLDQAVSANYRASNSALYLAESGFEMTLVDLRADRADDPADNWLTSWFDTSGGTPRPRDPFPDVSGTEVNGHRLRRVFPSSDPYPGTPYALGDPVRLGSGTYERVVWLPPALVSGGGGAVQARVQMRAVGTDTSFGSPSSVTLESGVVVDMSSSGSLNQALMIGDGQGNRYFDGRIEVAGSIHLAAQHEPWQTWLPWADFSSGSVMKNSYAGIGDPAALGALAAKLPPIGTTDVGGELSQTLDAVLRMSTGGLYPGFYGSIGEAEVAGNGVKDTIDAVLSDGVIYDFFGAVQADTTGPYDGTGDPFFDLRDAYTDPVTGKQFGSFESYLESSAFAPVKGHLDIDCRTDSFSSTDPFGRGSVAWDQDTDTLTVDGLVYVSGDLRMARPQGNCRGEPDITRIEYAGTGTIFAENDVEVHSDLIPRGQYLADGPDADTVIDGNLGLIAGRDMELALSNQDGRINVIAALFAQRRTRIGNTADIAGSLVTGYLDVDGGQTARIWQVPALATLAPPGMPAKGGDFSVQGMGLDSWYQRR